MVVFFMTTISGWFFLKFRFDPESLNSHAKFDLYV